MELIPVILMLFASINLANCSRLTGPYEAIFFYYAYQIDAAAAAKAAEDGVLYTRTIGAECMDRPCTLAEFMRTIMDPDNLSAFRPTENAGTTSPDVHAIAEEIDEEWNYKSTNLRMDMIIEKAPENFAGVVSAVVSKIQQARAVVPSADLVAKAAAALQWARSIRLSELVVQYGTLNGYKAQAFLRNYKPPTLKVKLRDLGIDETHTPSLPIIYDDLDYEGMASDMADGDAANEEELLRDFMNWSKTKPITRPHQNHQTLVDVYERSVQSLEAGCS
ncbi:hypothetical protein BO82DRAFT_421135 [Aspergillus uvarum CBS 121591]|uniref:Uncharacterized protein n=1 Tax=Aspergillus uvarum CBS 121591 TaxID=1448315 RepID=A0A319C4L1_9EURO|nr:hypothetical protein BO82DRAFT_421135 [Aspergillus uvarum CBS 121591]PYH78860.1 hypothetical protein BO82DRAFT_421135 [Aspergillus uvarum CBS 121591]